MITLMNVENENMVNARQHKEDLRANKVQQKEQEVDHMAYLNALTREKMKEQTEKR